MKNIKNQKGATLVESLVSLVILAIAVIGMLGVQLRTLIETNMSGSRAQAMLLTQDLSERIKANPKGFASLDKYKNQSFESTPASTLNCQTSSCTPDQMADYDLQQWGKSVVNQLPNGKARTFISSDDSRQLGVLIGWNQQEKGTSDNYLNSFKIPEESINSGINCWTNHICHLTYIQP